MPVAGPAGQYFAYGLRVRSEIALPELGTCEGRDSADIDVRLGEVEGQLPATGIARFTRLRKDDAYLAWPHIGRFLVTRSGQVTVDSLAKDERYLRFALLGPVLAAALQLRGIPLLHGSAVATDSSAILFVGRKGAGKSTTAAAFAAEGCAILNDDVLPLVHNGSAIEVAPGFPALKLAPAMHQALLSGFPVVGADSMRPLGKVVVSGRSAGSAAIPVGTIVILDPDSPPEATHLPPAVALPELLNHGYALKFGSEGLGNGQAEALFDTCSRLTREAHVIRVGRHGDPCALRTFARSWLGKRGGRTAS